MIIKLRLLFLRKFNDYEGKKRRTFKCKWSDCTRTKNNGYYANWVIRERKLDQDQMVISKNRKRTEHKSRQSDFHLLLLNGMLVLKNKRAGSEYNITTTAVNKGLGWSDGGQGSCRGQGWTTVNWFEEEKIRIFGKHLEHSVGIVVRELRLWPVAMVPNGSLVNVRERWSKYQHC